MNVNVYIEDKIAIEINQAAASMHLTHNSIIREALKIWLEQHQKNTWPRMIMDFNGEPRFPRFESYRDELQEPGS